MSSSLGVVVVVAITLATVTNRLVACFVTPIFVKFKLDTWWQMPVAWIVGALLSLLMRVHIVAALFAALPGGIVYVSPLADLILTAILVGGGANLISDIVSAAPVQTVNTSPPIPTPVKTSLAEAILARESTRK